MKWQNYGNGQTVCKRISGSSQINQFTLIAKVKWANKLWSVWALYFEINLFFLRFFLFLQQSRHTVLSANLLLIIIYVYFFFFLLDCSVAYHIKHNVSISKIQFIPLDLKRKWLWLWFECEVLCFGQLGDGQA